MTSMTLTTIDGDNVTLESGDLQRLEDELEGGLLSAGDPGYDETCQLWNAMIRKRPGVVARCRSESDVAAAVRWAAKRRVLLAVKGGGHNIAGLALCDGGLVIDLSAMKGLALDVESQTATVEPGNTWADVDAYTQPHGLAVPSGIVTTTGVPGLTLGGGFGWTSRQFGLTCDQLIAMRVVTADGQWLTVSADEHPDLFWGLRGGGGNFGVVTRFDFRLQRVGPELVGGLRLFPISQANDVIEGFHQLTAHAPDELTALLVLRRAPAAPFIPEAVHGEPVAGIAVCYNGPVDAAWQALEPLKALGEPLADVIGVKPFVDHQKLLDAAQPPGRHYYWKSEYLGELPSDLPPVLIEHGRRIESPHSSMLMMHLGGAIERVEAESTAVGHRDAQYVINIAAAWENEAECNTHIDWAKGFHRAVAPFGLGGHYVNFMTGDEGQSRVRGAYNDKNWQQLRALKQRWDPENLFRVNQNIQPQ